ncbi:MAG: hypothetical protein IPJ78_03485 [Gemmatimonadetes bacterium]|nr:hypothetical protein [Gemmatimonadota bacterium]
MTLLLGAVELLNRAIVLRVSRIERRIDREYQAARRRSDPARVGLPVVGNSLLLDGVDEPSLSAMMPSPWELRRIVIEQTLFLDWSYGLEQLHARGGSASIEAVMLDTRQLGSDAFRGDYTAFRLIGPAQVIPFAREAGAASDRDVAPGPVQHQLVLRLPHRVGRCFSARSFRDGVARRDIHPESCAVAVDGGLRCSSRAGSHPDSRACGPRAAVEALAQSLCCLRRSETGRSSERSRARRAGLA